MLTSFLFEPSSAKPEEIKWIMTTFVVVLIEECKRLIWWNPYSSNPVLQRAQCKARPMKMQPRNSDDTDLTIHISQF